MALVLVGRETFLALILAKTSKGLNRKEDDTGKCLKS